MTAATKTGKSKAIIIDYSLKTTWAQLAYAINRLKNEDLLYLSGTKSKWILAGPRREILGYRSITRTTSFC